MTFREALEALKRGYAVKRKPWEGFWMMERDIYSPTGKNTVMMHCKNGEVLDIRHTEDVFFTLGNMAESDWEIVEMTCAG